MNKLSSRKVEGYFEYVNEMPMQSHTSVPERDLGETPGDYEIRMREITDLSGVPPAGHQTHTRFEHDVKVKFDNDNRVHTDESIDGVPSSQMKGLAMRNNMKDALIKIANILDEKGFYKESDELDIIIKQAGNKLQKLDKLVQMFGGWDKIIEIILSLKKQPRQPAMQPVQQPVQQNKGYFSEPNMASIEDIMAKEAFDKKQLLQAIVALLASLSGFTTEQVYVNPQEAVQKVQQQEQK